jgi:hypothetical protein
MARFRHAEIGQEVRKRHQAANDDEERGKAALLEKRAIMRSKDRLNISSSRALKATSKGRLTLPEFVHREWPRGFDEGLSEEYAGEPAFQTAPSLWFR